MTTFSLKTGHEITGPMTAEELKANGGISARTLIRPDESKKWSHLTELLWTDSNAVEHLEEGIDPHDGVADGQHRRNVRRFATVALFVVVGTLWIVVDAVSIRSYAAWASALVVLCATTLATGGILARFLWAWHLTILLSAALSARLLALTISSFGVGLSILLGLQLVATGLLIAWRPRGPALSWPPRLRRLLCIYSNEPKAELETVPRVRLEVGPTTAALGVVLFFGLTLGASLVPRDDGWSRLVPVLVYLVMIVMAWTLSRRRLSELNPTVIRGVAPGAVRAGVVGFLFLSMLLLAGRWTLRAFEVAEYRLATDIGLLYTKVTPTVRDAICDVVHRGPSEGSFSLSYALWVYGITLVLGPICEEVFFRGLVFASLRQRWPFWAAAIASGLAFAVPHMLGATWGPATVLFLFEIAAGGVAAAFVYETSGSLLAPIVLHILWNMLQEASSLGG